MYTSILEKERLEADQAMRVRLEKPCLAHIAGDPSKVDSPAGHALTASAQLFSLESPTWCTSYTLHKPVYHDQPTALLENLLSLAPDVCPDGELTPVQIWNMVREQPDFATLQVATLQTLMDTIREAVKCHGYVEPGEPRVPMLT